MAKTEKVSKPIKEKKPDGRKNNPNIGRPKIQKTPELFKRICDLIAVTPKSIYDICKENPDIPKPSTLLDWIGHDEEFSRLYLDAKQKQVLAHMEETYKIADFGALDTTIGDDGKVRIDSEIVARAKIRIDLRKWQAARLMPRLFGEKTEVTTNSVADEELKSTVSEIKSAVDLLAKHERDY